MDWTGPLLGEPWDLGEPDPDKRAIIEFVAGCSVETVRKVGPRTRSDRDLLPPGTRVHIGSPPNLTLHDTVSAAKSLREEGFDPVPHIVAWRIDGPAHLEDHLSRLCGEADVREVLVIGADPCAAAEPLPSALELLRTGLFDSYGFARIGIAVYPDAHRFFPPRVLRDTVARYNAWARRSDAQHHFVTRTCLDAEAIFAWEEAARLAGSQLPVHVGLVGPTTPGTLLDLGLLFDIGTSVGELAHRGFGPLARAALTGPDRTVTTLARRRRERADCTFRRAHFVAFDGVRGAALWLDAVLRGAFDMREEGEGFAVRYHAAS